METNQTGSDLIGVVMAARAAEAEAHAAWSETDDGTPESIAAEAVYDAARATTAATERAYHAQRTTALVPWILRDDESGVTEECEPCTLVDARERAEEWAREGDYHIEDGHGTIWVDVRIVCPVTGDVEETVTAAIDPAEPPCGRRGSVREHDWQSPIEIVGGIGENPGVWGHGGGVVITEVCMHCGCARRRDTWAQRLDTGEQGLESVRYEPGQYAEEIARLAAEAEVAS